MKEGRSDEPAQQRSDVRGVRPAHDANALFFAKALFALVCIKNGGFRSNKRAVPKTLGFGTLNKLFQKRIVDGF
jgi:hypothetical protein